MGYLYQGATGIADTSMLTISMWVRIPSTYIPVTPESFVYISLFSSSSINQSHIIVRGYTAPITQNSLDPIGITASFWSPVYETPTGNRAKYISAATTAPATFNASGGQLFTFDLWHHLLVAVDVTQGGFYCGENYANQTGAYFYPFYIYLDGIASIVSWSSNFQGEPYSQYSGHIRGWHPSGEAGWTPDGHSGSNFLLTGLPIALPRSIFPGYDSISTPIEYADVQVWFGTFIDPTISANYAKFVNITGGRGYPVNPTTAAAAFGQQTILFKGKASDNSFYMNRGNGGTFNKIGTASDFTPTPSY